jgi:uncharacterized membrane protein YeaQ/YmgE (transglycosylase-associated protein family)
MGILSWIIIGGLAGWIASLVMNTDKSMGLMANIIVGIIGGLIGGFLVSLFGGAGITGFNVWSLVVAVLGSIILLGIVKAVRGGGKE